MASPFGFLIPPLAPLVPPELQAQAISPNQLAYTFPASSIGSHISVFLLPGQTLPTGSAAALYIQFPGQSDFKFLGALGEGKASAVFRVAGLKHGTALQPAGGEVDMDADENTHGGGAGADASAQGDVTIGISLEATADVAAKVAENKKPTIQPQQSNGQPSSINTETALVRIGAGPTAGSGQGTSSTPSTKVLAQRIIKNAFNFLASFEGGTGMVPIKAFEGWWQKFERRVENDPGFLEREQD